MDLGGVVGIGVVEGRGEASGVRGEGLFLCAGMGELSGDGTRLGTELSRIGITRIGIGEIVEVLEFLRGRGWGGGTEGITATRS